MNKLKTEKLFNYDYTIAKPLLESTAYPWEILSKIESYILELGKTLDKNIYEEKEENIWIAKSAKVAETAALNGPLIICEDAEIRHCAFIRGNAIIGKGAVVGNSTEIKNSILFDEAQVPHFNYIGDSVLGYRAHTGAGAITSNLRSDKSLIFINVEDDKVETNLKKIGAMIGDNVEVGCGSVLNPGTIIGKDSHVYPLSMVRGYVDENSIYKNTGEILKRE